MSTFVPVCAAARGRLRVLCAKLDAEAHRIEAAAARLPRSLLRDAGEKGHVGAARAMARVLTGMPVPPLQCDGRSAAFRYLAVAATVPAAAGAPAAPADDQVAVVVNAVLVNAGGRPRMSLEPFGCAFSLHSLGRLLERTAFAADPVKAMYEAHDALLALPVVEGGKIFGLAELTLPAAGGAFLCYPRVVGARESPLAVARTWISADQMRADQAAGAAAWRGLLEPASFAKLAV